MAALALGSASGLSGAVAFVNGDFEANADAYVVWPGYNGSTGVNTQPPPSNPSAAAGWTAEGGAGVNKDGLISTDSIIGGGQFVGAPVNPFIDNGVKTGGVAFLQGNSHIEQTISGFVAGAQYILSFDYNARNGPATEGSVFINGTQVIPWSTVTAVGGANPFYTLSVPFPASADTLTFRFANRVPAAGGDVTLLLDNISVRAVPEPGAAALLLLGSAALLRRGRRQA